jgi:hypothetical protein
MYKSGCDQGVIVPLLTVWRDSIAEGKRAT